MELQVALELLGLGSEEAASQEQIRRAYMRKLRYYPPERDPDGFKRLREAYERARTTDETPVQPTEPAEVALNDADNAPPLLDELDDGPADVVVGLRDELSAIAKLVNDGRVNEAETREHNLRAAHGQDYKAMGDTLALRWLMLRELLATAVALSPWVRKPIAMVVIDGEPEDAFPTLMEFRHGSPDQALDTLSFFAQRAPTLHSVFGRPLSVSITSGEGSTRPILKLVGGLVVFLTLLFIFGRDDISPPVRSPLYEIVPGGSGDWNAMIADLDALGSDGSLTVPEQVAARVAATSARAHDCWEVQRALFVMEDQNPQQVRRIAVANAFSRFKVICTKAYKAAP